MHLYVIPYSYLPLLISALETMENYIITILPMYVRMYVCTYVCMYVCMYVRMYVCMYVRMYVHMYVHMYVCTCKQCISAQHAVSMI